MKFKYGQLEGLKEAETLTLKFSTSGNVIAVGAFRGLVHPWFPASTTYRFSGFHSEINLIWDDLKFVHVP